MDQKHRDKATAELLNGSLEFLSELDKIIAENSRRPDIEDLVFDEHQFACTSDYDFNNHGDDWNENDPEVIEAFELYLSLYTIDPAVMKAGTEWCWNCYNSEAGPKEQIDMCDYCWGNEPKEKLISNESIWYANYMQDWGEDRTLMNPYHDDIADIVIVDGVRYKPSPYHGKMFHLR